MLALIFAPSALELLRDLLGGGSTAASSCRWGTPRVSNIKVPCLQKGLSYILDTLKSESWYHTAHVGFRRAVIVSWCCQRMVHRPGPDNQADALLMVRKWLLQTETSRCLNLMLMMWLLWSLLLMIMKMTQNYWSLESVHFAKRGCFSRRWQNGLSFIPLFYLSLTTTTSDLRTWVANQINQPFGYDHPQIPRHQAMIPSISQLFFKGEQKGTPLGNLASKAVTAVLAVQELSGMAERLVAMLTPEERYCWHEYCTGYLWIPITSYNCLITNNNMNKHSMRHNDEYIQTLQMNLTSGDPSSNHPWKDGRQGSNPQQDSAAVAESAAWQMALMAPTSH